MQYASKEAFESHLHITYTEVCNLLRRDANYALTSCLTLDGWSAALGEPILGVTWNYIYHLWRLKCVPICILNTRDAYKSSEQLRCIVDEVLKESPVIGSDDISIHTITSYNEPSVARACDILTNCVGSIRSVVQTIALCVKDVFEEGIVWQQYMHRVKDVTKYFKYHTKASVLLLQKQSEGGVTNDRLKRLKHEIPTRWHSRLGAMLS